MIMQIKRNILGTDVLIDLTDGEILDAHYEAERYNTQEMLNERLMQEENIIDEIPDELFKQMVKETMDELASLNEHMGSNIFPAMDAVIARHKDELRKEEPWGLFEIECTQTKKVKFTVRAKNDDDADIIFAEWREHHIREYDDAFADAEVDDEEIDTAYACEGDPDYADITVEE